MKKNKKGEPLFKDIDNLKNESKYILKTPVDEEEDDRKDFQEPKHRTTESTPLSTKRKKSSSYKRKKNSQSSTSYIRPSKKIRSSDENNKSLDLFSGNESIPIKDVQNIEVSLKGDIDLAKTINLSSDEIEGKSELPSPSLITKELTIGKQTINGKFEDHNDKNGEEEFFSCVSSSILNQRLSNVSFDENNEKACRILNYGDQGNDDTLVKLENLNDSKTPCGSDLNKCLSEDFYESAFLDENLKTQCATKLFDDSEFTKNESALMKLELTEVEYFYNSYPQNTFYGLPLNLKEILIQTRGISKLYGEL